MNKWLLVFTIFACVGLSAFMVRITEDKPVPVPPSRQRLGDAQKGYEYLTTGNYVRSGIPFNAFLFGNGPSTTNYLKREGRNAMVSHEYTVVNAPNGEPLVAPNCLQCHAQVFDNRLVMGLGNSLADYSDRSKLNLANLELMEKILKANAPKQYEAAASFLTVAKAITPYLYTGVRGVNPADRLASLLAAHRDPITFQWIDTAQLVIPDQVIPTDVPAWWLLKKKNAMFYNGFGRGDFGRFLMASNLLTVHDTSESREVDRHMPDVLAYLYSLQAPKFPASINPNLAAKGKIIFEQSCSRCHGTYGPSGTYPNLLIPESIIQTDSLLYRSNYSNPQFIQWFNKSWLAMGDHPARLEPFEGYMAPPLDGIWITAPYLHNGSVPTLEGILNSSARPRYWTRNFDSTMYNYEQPGWIYTEKEKPGGPAIYNTDLPGYGNYGHYFGDALTEAERKAVIEYLKTL
jgi:mono/diheme cytochrome c family protein